MSVTEIRRLRTTGGLERDYIIGYMCKICSA